MPSPPPVRRRRLLLAALLGSLFLLVLPDSLQRPLRDGALDLLSPVLSPLAAAWDASLRWLLGRTALGPDRVLLDQVQALQGDLAAREAELASLRRQLRASTELPERLRASVRVLSARVIGTDAVRWRRSLVLDRGAEDGIRAGHPVVCGRVLVGRVASVGRRACRVQCLTDPDSRVWVLLGAGEPEVPDAGRIQGVAQGESGGRLRLALCARPALVRTGDVVHTAGYDERYPAGLWVGRVSQVDGEGSEGAEVEIAPAADLDAVEDLQVLVPRAAE